MQTPIFSSASGRAYLLLIAIAAMAVVGSSPGAARAQVDVKVGLRGGVSSTTGGGEGLLTDSLGRRTGIVAGGIVEIDWGRVSIQPELLWNRKGWTAEFGDIRSTATFDYLELPVLAVLELPGTLRLSPHLMAGPTAGFLLDAEGELHTDTEQVEFVSDRTDSYRDLEVGLALGGRMDADLGLFDLLVELRYQLSVRNVNDRAVNPEGDVPFIRHRGITATIGLLRTL